MKAYHDIASDAHGINTVIAQHLIDILLPHGDVYITSEGELEPQFEKYRLQINPLDIHHVLDVLEKAWQTCAQEPAHYDIKVRYTLSTAIALIAEHMISIQTDISPKHLRDSERIKTMLQYIMDNYGKAIDTTAIARSASVSESECLRCFRAAIGTTPIRYLREYRIEQAANRLANSQASIADIAAGCGFQDISYFTKTFREMKGVTPKVYQKEH